MARLLSNVRAVRIGASAVVLAFRFLRFCKSRTDTGGKLGAVSIAPRAFQERIVTVEQPDAVLPTPVLGPPGNRRIRSRLHPMKTRSASHRPPYPRPRSALSVVRALEIFRQTVYCDEGHAFIRLAVAIEAVFHAIRRINVHKQVAGIIGRFSQPEA